MVVLLTTISQIPTLVSLRASQGISHLIVLTSSHEHLDTTNSGKGDLRFNLQCKGSK
jgi:hypothetical protein